MHPELQRNVDAVRKCEHWERVVADAAPGDHIVQLYQDQDFLNCAFCRFVGAGLANGEGIMLFPTLTHWNAFRPRFEAEGVDVRAAQERGQLTVARAIHKRSKRSGRAFIRVNCAAVPASLIPSELFGHEKGSFTGALQRRVGPETHRQLAVLVVVLMFLTTLSFLFSTPRV